MKKLLPLFLVVSCATPEYNDLSQLDKKWTTFKQPKELKSKFRTINNSKKSYKDTLFNLSKIISDPSKSYKLKDIEEKRIVAEFPFQCNDLFDEGAYIHNRNELNQPSPNLVNFEIIGEFKGRDAKLTIRPINYISNGLVNEMPFKEGHEKSVNDCSYKLRSKLWENVFTHKQN